MKNFQKCDRVSVVALSLAVFLGILAFVPSNFLPAGILKGYLLVVCVLVAFVSWLVGRLIEGAFHIPWTPLLAAAGVFTFVTLLSAFFSHTPYLSFLGEGFEAGTVAVLGSLFLGMALAMTLFTTRKRIFTFLSIFFVIYVVLAVFQLIHVIFPTATMLHTFANRVDSPLGLWSDFAFLSGAAVIGSLLMLQFAKPVRLMKAILIKGFVLGLFFVILSNIMMVWILVGFSSIVILIYTLISNRFSETRMFPFLAFAVSLASLLFILANSLFGGILAGYMHTSYIDIHPTLQATVHTSLASLRQHPIFGAGPNRFLREWLTNRPTLVNMNTLWDAPFTSGSSFFGTISMLGGGLGIIAGILFLLAFGYESVRKIFVGTSNSANGMSVFGLFMIALYFILSIVFFSPGIVTVICAFLFTGIFFGSLVGEKRIPVKDISFLKDQRASFFSILAIVALLMISAGGVYASTERFSSLVFFEKSVARAQTNDISGANARLTQAIALSDLPLFERTRVFLAERSIQQTLSLPSGSTSTDALQTALQGAISVGNTAARNAITIDPADPANYLTLGDFLRMLVPLKLDGVLTTAEDAYNRAITLAPHYPKPYLSLAQLYFDAGDNKNARVYVQKALDEKSNYTDAFFLQAQIEISDGNTDLAIKKIQDATLIDPNNPDTYFELGYLRYNSGDYTNAVRAFEVTININPQYWNAWYYLALAEQKTGATKDATDILTALHNRFPDNTNITNALNPSSAASGTSSKTSTSSKQEKAKKLPLPTDTTSSKTTQ